MLKTRNMWAIPRVSNAVFKKSKEADEINVNNTGMLNHFSPVRLFVNLWTVALQAPRSMGLSRQEYWSGLPFPSPGIFPTQESNPHL